MRSKRSCFSVLLFAISFAISGCETFENRLTTTIQGDRLFVNSTYGPFSIGTELSQEDARELKRLRELAAKQEQK